MALARFLLRWLETSIFEVFPLNIHKSEISVDDNWFALSIFGSLLKLTDGFVFFGTLLGLIREGAPIKGDDDVDFYVDVRHFEHVKKTLMASGFKIDVSAPPNNTLWFLQADGHIEGRQIRADFYFFDQTTDIHFVIEPWNFMGTLNNTQSHLRIPKTLLFPLASRKFGDIELNFPACPEVLCEFLYGLDWRTPKKKGTDYHTNVIGGRPVRFSVNDSGGFSLLP